MDIQSYRQPSAPQLGGGGGGDLADILERVLDKGIVVAGDIAINLLDIELLTIKLRLLIASADTAKKMGIDWWENDPFLSGKSNGSELESRLDRIESALSALAENGGAERSGA
ncbi:MAG: gas vesicle protein [Actinomycetota bacterium]|nr:gas vesicle protein [Actinomycetota bacterium]